MTHTADPELFKAKLYRTTKPSVTNEALEEEAAGNAQFFSAMGAGGATYSFKEAAMAAKADESA